MSENRSYRIVRLVNGDKLIAKITGSNKSKLFLERPMVIEEIIGTQSINSQFAIKREFLVLVNWIEFSKSNVVGIPKEHVLTIYDPDELVTNAYNTQKEREDTGLDELKSLLSDENNESYDSQYQSDISDIVNDIVNGNIQNFMIKHEENSNDEDWSDIDIDKGRNDYGNELSDWSPYLEDYFRNEEDEF